MRTICKALIFTSLLFCNMTALGQCEIYLHKGDSLFLIKKYEEAKRQYLNYKECRQNAQGIDVKIAECDRLLSQSSNQPPITQVKPPDTSNNAMEEILRNMVFVEGGTFMMGSNDNDSEKPMHQVILSSFYISKYEITQRQWIAVIGNNPSRIKGDNLPVENVSWNEVQIFIDKLNSQTGKYFRLPTEAEWEYAARGGNKSKGYIYSGSNNIDDVAWYQGNSGNITHTVGSKMPNELGIYDMSGNVCEFCNDWYDSYSNSVQSDPQGPSNSQKGKVVRGGSGVNFFDLNSAKTITNRNQSINPSVYCGAIGFRLVSSQDVNTTQILKVEELMGSNTVYWTKFGTIYHLYDDCILIDKDRTKENFCGIEAQARELKSITELCSICENRADKVNFFPSNDDKLRIK